VLLSLPRTWNYDYNTKEVASGFGGMKNAHAAAIAAPRGLDLLFAASQVETKPKEV